MPADLVPQIPLVKKLLEVFGVPCLELAGYEADDVLATVSVQTVSAGGECTLVTSDKDARQLLGPHVRLLNLRNNAFVGEAELLADWGYGPIRLSTIYHLSAMQLIMCQASQVLAQRLRLVCYSSSGLLKKFYPDATKSKVKNAKRTLHCMEHCETGTKSHTARTQHANRDSMGSSGCSTS